MRPVLHNERRTDRAPMTTATTTSAATVLHTREPAAGAQDRPGKTDRDRLIILTLTRAEAAGRPR
jgi:hypothetical protein